MQIYTIREISRLFSLPLSTLRFPFLSDSELLIIHRIKTPDFIDSRIVFVLE